MLSQVRASRHLALDIYITDISITVIVTNKVITDMHVECVLTIVFSLLLLGMESGLFNKY